MREEIKKRVDCMGESQRSQGALERFGSEVGKEC